MPLPEPPPLGTPMLPPGTFHGQVVLITGGGTGLGKAMALEFARLGAGVGIVSRSEAHRRAGVEAVGAAGGRAAEAGADVRREDQVAAAFDRIEAALGPVDVLVNNAAGNFPVAAADLSPNGWRAVVDIVLNGTFLCSREFGARCRAARRPGAILNVLATQAFTGGPGMAHSAAAKAGVDNLTKTLAVEWGLDGIRVNSLAPGLFHHGDFRAEFDAVAGDDDPGGAFDRRTPGGRAGRLQELGWAATYLCSPFAAYVSGHSFVIDGAGQHRRSFLPPEFEPIADQIAAGARRPEP